MHYRCAQTLARLGGRGLPSEPPRPFQLPLQPLAAVALPAFVQSLETAHRAFVFYFSRCAPASLRLVCPKSNLRSCCRGCTSERGSRGSDEKGTSVRGLGKLWIWLRGLLLPPLAATGGGRAHRPTRHLRRRGRLCTNPVHHRNPLRVTANAAPNQRLRRRRGVREPGRAPVPDTWLARAQGIASACVVHAHREGAGDAVGETAHVIHRRISTSR